MRRFFIISLAFVITALVGCAKDDIDTSANYEVVVNVEKCDFRGVTRAPRSEWIDGDQIVVVFSGDLSGNKSWAPYLLLTYNKANNSWAQNWVGTTANDVAQKQDKSLAAIYGSSGFRNATFSTNFKSLTIETQATVPYRKAECVMKCDQSEGSYTVSDNVITLNIPMTPLVSQFTIRGISLENDSWTLKCEQLITAVAGEIRLTEDGLKVQTVIITSNFSNGVLAYPSSDGVAFFAEPKSSDTKNYTFTLTNGTKTYTRTFKDKSISVGDAVIMNGPGECEVGEETNGWRRIQ